MPGVWDVWTINSRTKKYRKFSCENFYQFFPQHLNVSKKNPSNKLHALLSEKIRQQKQFFNSTWCITKLLGKKSDRSTSGFPETFQPFNSCHAVWLKVLGYYHFQRFDQTDWVTESYLAATLFLWGNLRSQIDRFNEQTCSHASIQSSWTTQPQVRTFPATAGALSALLCWKNLQAETG